MNLDILHAYNQAMLSLTNEVDGSKYVYNLNGTATPPGALDTISIVCEARTKFTHTLTLPNMSKNWMIARFNF